jgi:hypothetical protein
MNDQVGAVMLLAGGMALQTVFTYAAKVTFAGISYAVSRVSFTLIATDDLYSWLFVIPLLFLSFFVGSVCESVGKRHSFPSHVVQHKPGREDHECLHQGRPGTTIAAHSVPQTPLGFLIRLLLFRTRFESIWHNGDDLTHDLTRWMALQEMDMGLYSQFDSCIQQTFALMGMCVSIAYGHWNLEILKKENLEQSWNLDNVCVIGQPVFLIAMVAMFTVIITVQQYYSQTAVALKDLDSLTRSPLLNQLEETVDGMVTVRAFGAGGDGVCFGSWLLHACVYI